MYIIAQGCRLRNDLYCVEWDVKLYYTIPYQTSRGFSATANTAYCVLRAERGTTDVTEWLMLLLLQLMILM